jgi:hypothetical protein
LRPARYILVLSLIWVVAMTWRLYPHFKDALRIDGRLVAFDDYVEESCGQRVGPAAASCLQEAYDTGRRLLAREQANSVLWIEAPLFGYLLIYLPAGAAIRRFARPARRLPDEVKAAALK